MVDLAEIQAAYYMVAATGVLIAAVFYVLNLRISRRNQELMLKAQQQTLETRQAQFMMQLNESMTNVEVWKNIGELMNMEWTDIDDFEKRWGSGGNPEAAAKRFNIWWRLNFLGNLFQRNLVDREWVYDSFSTTTLMQWFKWEPIITQSRKFFNNPQYFAEFEYLAKEMIKMDEQKGIKRFTPKTLSYEDAHIGKIEHGRTDLRSE